MLYSFIIPHKNTVSLLQRCIDSIPQREDAEIIIVDDCSDAEDIDFDHFPGSDRSDVIVIRNYEPIGAGPARNMAIKQAKGKWLIFSDSDDYFTNNLTLMMDKYANDSDIDMVIWNANSINEIGEEKKLIIDMYISNFYKNRINALNTLRYHFWAPWSRMIKRSIYLDNGLEFENVPFGNDIKGILTASRLAKSIAVERYVVYMYWKPTMGSQTHLKQHAKTKYSLLLSVEQILFINKLYMEVNYPFLWPVLIPRELIDDTMLKNILNKYKFSKWQNYVIKVKYIIAKILKLI